MLIAIVLMLGAMNSHPSAHAAPIIPPVLLSPTDGAHLLFYSTPW